MSDFSCNVAGCPNRSKGARGMCVPHYRKWSAVTPAHLKQNALPLERFRAGYEVAPSGCWDWIRSKKSNGYGQLHFRGGNWQAHRVAYTLLVGEIPEGMTVDHLCRNRGCVNPDHMELCPAVENYLRAVASRTHCKHGHPYDLTAESRVCETCTTSNRKKSEALKAERLRVARGGRHNRYKYTDEDVAAIRRLVASGMSRREVAAQFSCATQYVDKVVTGKIRTELTGVIPGEARWAS